MKTSLRASILLLVVASVVLLAFTVWQQQERVQPSADNRPIVLASFYPLKYLLERLGGDDLRVIQLAAGGVDVHDVQVSPQDLVVLRSARLFVFNGGVDSWAEGVRKEAERQGVPFIEITEALGLASPHDEEHETEEAHEEGEEDEHMHTLPGGVNPHVWLDPVRFGQAATILEEELVQLLPEHAQSIRQRAVRLHRDLAELDAAFTIGLQACRIHDVYIAHDAFRYLTDRYGLLLQPLAGSLPEEEPSPKRLGELAQHARAAHIPVVFTETLVSPKLAETFAREIGARVLSIHPVEGLTAEEDARGDDYLSLMRKNLQTLQDGLMCTK